MQVAHGEYCEGSANLVRPPPKDPSKPNDDLYDSCVDNVCNPSIFVTFDRYQSYPEYLIEYTQNVPPDDWMQSSGWSTRPTAALKKRKVYRQPEKSGQVAATKLLVAKHQIIQCFATVFLTF